MELETAYNCCLCCLACTHYKHMQSTSGESTDFYNITVKYFDPMLIADSKNDCSSETASVLCESCWRHIDNFNEFQSDVLKSRSLLQCAANEVSLQKLEEGKPIGQCNNGNTNKEADDIESCDIYNELCNDDFEDHEPQMHSMSTVTVEAENGPLEEHANGKLQEDEMSIKTFGKEKRGNTRVEICSEDMPMTEKDVGRSVYTLEKGREIDSFIAQWKPQLECDLCPVTAPNFDSLRSHFRLKHKTRFYIKCCDRKFYCRCILVDHIRLHVNPEAHKCDICGKSSTSKYNLKLHKQIVHNGVRNYECKICHKNFNHKPTLDRHLLIHATGNKEFFCKDCGKGYVKQVQLNTHIRNVHSGIRICEQCGKTFYNAGGLKKHLIEHGVIPQPKFPCDSCSVELKSNEALKRHKAAYHHDGSTVYICSICGKVAASEHALLSHKKFVHEDNRKHKCTFCDKAFRTAIVLREHIATHTGEDLYECPHCPQTFKTNANMHHHRKRVHPVEWAESRKNRVRLPIVNLDQLRNQVIL